MPARTGANTFIGAKLHNTFDTYTAAGSGEQLMVDSLNASVQADELTSNPIGSGLIMQRDSDFGGINPTLQMPKKARYDDIAIGILQQLFGSETTASLGSGAYLHSIMVNENINSNFVTVAFHADSAAVHEYKNGVCTQFNFNANTNDYLMQDISLLASNRLITGTTNSAANLAATTLPTNSPITIVRSTDKFRINAQTGGALADGDKVDVTQVEIEFARPQEHVDEIRNAAGNGQPRMSGLLEATVTITLRTKADDTWYTAWAAGTEYKADFVVSGATIGGGFTYQWEFNFPRLKIVQDPQYAPSNPGENEMVVVFKSLVAAGAPTGMFDKYPYVRVRNTRTTNYRA